MDTKSWERLRQKAVGIELAAEPYPIIRFGDSPELQTELAELVLAGNKTATCSSLWELEADGEEISVGSRWIVVDGRGRPRCIVETIKLDERSFESVDADFAILEGEGDGSLESWRAGHRRYFSRVLPKIGKAFSETMPVICEQFRVICRFDDVN